MPNYVDIKNVSDGYVSKVRQDLKFKTGNFVISKAGHDKGKAYLTVELTQDRILVADDDANVHQSLNAYFRREGYQMISAYDGAQAVGICSLTAK